jgi:hypothetical protein
VVNTEDAQGLKALPAYNADKARGGRSQVLNIGQAQPSVDQSDPSPRNDPSSSAEPNPLCDVKRSDQQENASGPASGLEQDIEHMNDSLLNVVDSGWQGLDMAELIANNYGEDSFFKQILDSPKSFRNLLEFELVASCQQAPPPLYEIIQATQVHSVRPIFSPRSLFPPHLDIFVPDTYCINMY